MSSVNRILLNLVGFLILVVSLELVVIINYESMYAPTVLWKNKPRMVASKKTLQAAVRSPVLLPDSDRRPGTLLAMEPDHWQPLNATNEVFVYSAFIEESETSFVRIIGAILKTSTIGANLYCIMRYGSVETRKLKSKVYIIPESRKKPFSAAFFTCNITKSSDGPPTSVSLVVGPQENTTLNVLPVHDQTVLMPQFNLTACVCPLFSPQNKKNIIEWVETNKILGVELFTVYVNEINDEERHILTHYKSTGIVEIRNWTLSEGTSPPWDGIHYRGQLTALNDCLYRNKGRSKFTMVIDLDELILPSEPTDLALLKLVQRLPKGDNGLYIFRHSFHGPAKHVNGKSDDTALNKTVNGSEHHDTAHKYTVELNMLNNFARAIPINVPRSRSKVIFRPETVHTLGIHFAWGMIPPYEQHVVDPSDALVHHYRSRAFKKNVEDKTAEAYMDRVIVSMNRTLNSMGNV